MSAPRVLPSPLRPAAPHASRYFDHRAATCRSVEILVGAELDVLWSNAAALALVSRHGPVSLNDNRLILAQRRHEDGLRAFLAGLREETGVWVLSADEVWLVRAETIAPPDAPPAWLLTWQLVTQADRYLWADIGLHLRLTPSETRTVRSLMDGSTIEQTATRQGVSIQTARTHVRRIYAKLGVNNREQLFATVLPYRWG